MSWRAALGLALLLAGVGCDVKCGGASARAPSPADLGGALVALRKTVSPGDVFRIEGELVEPGPAPAGAGRLLVAAVTNFPGPQVAAFQLAQPHDGGRSSRYGILVGSGDYELLVFQDADGDGKYERGEVVGRSGPAEVTAGLSSAPDGFTVPGPSIHVDRAAPRDAGFAVSLKAEGQGPLVELDSSFYDAKWGFDGLWRPSRFIEHTQGSFLFGVEEYDPGKTLVLFVHGVKGRPPEFAALSAALDPARYQSWFVYYPSGLPLDKLGAMVADYLAMVGARSPRVVLVAHSMGGLVCRSALKHLTSDPGRSLPPALKGYVSFSSPYGGDRSARPTGDVPLDWPLSFRDIVPESDFLADLYASPYPAGLPFFLFYGSLAPGQGDGTIELSSQLDERMKAHATYLRGFEATHAGILEGPEERAEFRNALARLAAR